MDSPAEGALQNGKPLIIGSAIDDDFAWPLADGALEIMTKSEKRCERGVQVSSSRRQL